MVRCGAQGNSGGLDGVGRSEPVVALLVAIGPAECVLAERGCAFAGVGGAQEWLVEAVLSACGGGGLAEGVCELERGSAFGGG